MEHVNTLIGNTGEGSPFHINEDNNNNKGIFRMILQNVLLANYSLSVYLNNWREEMYTTFAAKITCFEIFSVLITLQYIFYPKLKNQQDVIYFCSLAAAIFYISIFYIRTHVMLLFKNFKIKRLHHLKGNDLPSRTTAFFLLANSILISSAFTLKEIYEYHTRFFWWNH